MKKLFLILTALSMSFFLTVQGQPGQREIGLVFNNLDNFGLTFRTGTEKALWRFTTLYLAGNNTTQNADSIETKYTTTGFGLKFGREYRTTIIRNLEFRYGLDLSFSYSYRKSDINYQSVSNQDVIQKSNGYQPGINLVLGFNYVILEKLVIGAEVMPSISYTTGTGSVKASNNNNETKSKSSGFSYGFSNSPVLISVIYRFGKKK